MAQILMLVSSAKVIRLEDGTLYPTGYFVEEAIKPYDRFVAAGVGVVVATSDGQTPHPDPYGRASRLLVPESALSAPRREAPRSDLDPRVTP